MTALLFEANAPRTTDGGHGFDWDRALSHGVWLVYRMLGRSVLPEIARSLDARGAVVAREIRDGHLDWAAVARDGVAWRIAEALCLEVDDGVDPAAALAARADLLRRGVDQARWAVQQWIAGDWNDFSRDAGALDLGGEAQWSMAALGPVAMAVVFLSAHPHSVFAAARALVGHARSLAGWRKPPAAWPASVVETFS